MIHMMNLLFFLLAILATAQNAYTSQIFDTMASTEVIIASRTTTAFTNSTFTGKISSSTIYSEIPGNETLLGQYNSSATIPIPSSDRQPVMQTTGASTVSEINLTNTSMATQGLANSTTFFTMLSSRTSTSTGSIALSSLLNNWINSTGLIITPTHAVPSSLPTSNSPPNWTSFGTPPVVVSSNPIGTDRLSITPTGSTFQNTSGTHGLPLESSISMTINLPTTLSSIAAGIMSSLPIESLSNNSLVMSTSIPMDISTGIIPGGSPSVSLSFPASASAITPTTTVAVVMPPRHSTITPPQTTTTATYPDEKINSYLSMTTWDNYGVTSTITADTTISASLTSNSDWKKNFWLHTSVNGQPTDLPVVHCGCVCKKNCNNDNRDDDDAAALWIVYFNIPRVPNVQISLPNLPDFHLGGCIKATVPILNIQIPLGNCPPVSENGKHGHRDPDDPNNRNREPDPNDPSDQNDPEPSQEPSKLSSSKPRRSTSTSSSSSSCSGGVVTDYLTHISCPTSGAAATQCATAIETGTRSGCSLTGTASVTMSASGAACARQVWPTSYGPAIGYSQPGFEYGTYKPPDIFQSITSRFSSMYLSHSGGMTVTPTASASTTLSDAASGSVLPSDIGISEAPLSTTKGSTVLLTSSGSVAATPSLSALPGSSNIVSSSASGSDNPSGSPTGIASPSRTTKELVPSNTLRCENNKGQYWVKAEIMQKAISDFCEEASKSTGWDDGTGRIDNHKRIERVYNKDTNDQVVLLVSSTTNDLDHAFKRVDKNGCQSNMTKLFNECPAGQNIPGVDWRHGGENMDGTGLDWVIVTDKAKYYPGTCTILIEEHMWSGPKGNKDRHWATRTSIQDAQENVVTPIGGWDELYFDNQGINKVPGLYSELEIEAGFNTSGQETFHFTLGDYQFTPVYPQGQDGEKVPRCQVGDWHEPGADHYRNTSCWVYC